MKILLLGATGFIGNSIFHRLIGKHDVHIAGRTPIDGYANWKPLDFSDKVDWAPFLEDVDLVINAVGIIEGDFDRIQRDVPIELYEQCIEQEIKVIHISAIGAEKEQPTTPFLASKKATDSFLLSYKEAKVIYPGIVMGKHGKSAQFFTEMAALPVIPIFNNKKLLFVHINQLTELVEKIIEDFDGHPAQVFAVSEPEPLTKIFSALKGKKGRFVRIPEQCFAVLFALFPKASIGIFDKDTFKMFRNSNADDYAPLFPATSASIQPKNSLKSDVLPQLIALLALSFIWIWSGVSSLISWKESYGLMQEIGANHMYSILFIWLGSIADIFLGLAVFVKKYRKAILILQVLTMVTYMLILSIGAPHYWLHPFGVLSKNIPILALSYYLYRKQ